MDDFQRQLDQKIEDDQLFLESYGTVRTSVPSKAYLENYDRIFRADRGKENPLNKPQD